MLLISESLRTAHTGGGEVTASISSRLDFIFSMTYTLPDITEAKQTRKVGPGVRYAFKQCYQPRGKKFCEHGQHACTEGAKL